MRIFCAVRHSIDPKQYYGDLWSANFYPALRAMGHEVIESQTDLLAASLFMEVPSNFTVEELEVRARTTEQILEEVRAAHAVAPIGLFLSYFYNSHFDPDGFQELRRLSIPSVNFYCNSIYQFELVSKVAVKADFAWHTEKYARQSYLHAGANPVWVQMGADPKIYSPISALSRLPKACFVGQRYADRDRTMAALIRAGIPVEIYGPNWGHESTQSSISGNHVTRAAVRGRQRTDPGSWRSYAAVVRHNIRREGLFCGVVRSARQMNYRRETRLLTPLFAASSRGAVQPSELASVFAQHEVCLNFSNVWSDGRPGSKLIPHVRLRDFEAPMSRTCYLTGHTDEITDFYHVGREIDTYRSAEELVDKSRFYLSQPNAAEKLRGSGHQRALRDHSWRRRFEDLFSKIGLANAA